MVTAGDTSKILHYIIIHFIFVPYIRPISERDRRPREFRGNNFLKRLLLAPYPCTADTHPNLDGDVGKFT